MGKAWRLSAALGVLGWAFLFTWQCRAATPPDGPAATAPAEAQTRSTGAHDPGKTAAISAGPAAAAKGLRFNFRGVPLETVLKYMSEAAGFVIVLQTHVDGKVDVWSNQPLDRDEAVALLNTILNNNGYAVVREGRTLTVIKREDAARKNIPVRKGNDPDDIPEDGGVVTQIIPVRSLNAVQLTKDLAPLLAREASLIANESGNSLIMTDTQADIRHLAKIISALDSAGSGFNSLRVFPLKYADAKSVADIIKELFPAPDTSRPGANQNDVAGRFRGNRNGGDAGNMAAMAAMMGGGFGDQNGFPGGGRGGGERGGGDSNNGHTPSAHVFAVADDRGNSLVVSAPDLVMPTIEQLVRSLDVDVDETSEVRMFHLRNADATETADLLSNLYPDDSNQADISRIANRIGFTGFRGGPFGGGGFGMREMVREAAQSAGGTNDKSDRIKKLGKVIAVADARTGSLVVSAAKALMPQIEALVTQLDADPARKQKVHVIPLANADPQDVQQILQDLFPAPANLKVNSQEQMQNNPLQSRSQTLLQQQAQQGASMANGFGSPGSGSGRGF